MELRLAEKKDLPRLTALWQECFGDAPEEVNRFWSALFDKIQVFAAWERETPLSMLCALPLSLVDEMGESCPASYFYAVCTAPKHRRQGLCAKLMRFAENTLKKQGIDFTCLVPAETELFSFYGALGYLPAFYHRHYSLPAAGSNAKITKINHEAYQNLRQMQLYGAFADYSLPLLRWQQTLGEKTGAGLYRIETSDGVYCAAAEKWGSTLQIKELLPDGPEAAAALAARLGCESVHVRTEGDEAPFGMAKALSGGDIVHFSYLALAFD